MPEMVLPDSPKGSRFGWPKPARLEEFAARLNGEGLPTYRVVFQGQNKDLPIVRIPIDLPKYRMVNGRTASLQVEHLALNRDLRRDLFTGDAEMWDAQEAQHELLLKLGRQSELDKYFADAAHKQVDPLILDQHGFAVNGNRRLACWRELFHVDPAKYDHFQHIDVVVLPHANERDINQLEARLQIEKDIRAEYNWDAQANMMVSKMQRDGATANELCHLYKMKESELKELLDMRAYADEYLKSRGKADRWSEVSGQEHTFRRLVQSRQRLGGGVARKEMFKEAAFALIDEPTAVGRLYTAIPELAASLDKVADRLNSEFEVDEVEADDGLDTLFGGVRSSAADNENGLVNLLKEPSNLSRVRDVIADVLESERQIKKDVKKTGYLLDICAKANSALTSAVKDGLRTESKLGGVSKQLDEIEKHVEVIRAFLAKHA